MLRQIPIWIGYFPQREEEQVRQVIAEFNKDSLVYEELEKIIALNEKLKDEEAKRRAAEKEKEVAEKLSGSKLGPRSHAGPM